MFVLGPRDKDTLQTKAYLSIYLIDNASSLSSRFFG